MTQNPSNLLIVEDEPVARARLTAYLEREGYHVFCREDAQDVQKLIHDHNIDLCLIDINLPGKDGLTLTREIRTASDVGIIIVSGEGEQIDRNVGLECGADDYVVKPFDVRELCFRVKNLLWRVKAQHKRNKLKRTFEGWSIDVDKRELVSPQNRIQTLTAGEISLLLALVANAGKVMTRDQLMHEIRNRKWYPDDRYIDVLVAQIRKKFRKFDPEAAFIRTVRGTGYLFTPEVS